MRKAFQIFKEKYDLEFTETPPMFVQLANNEVDVIVKLILLFIDFILYN